MKTLLTSRSLHLILLLALLASALMLRAKDYNWIRSLRLQAFDMYNDFYPRPADDRVAIVDIDESSLRDDRLGQWPWPRTDIARMVDALKEMGARAIIFDVIFAERDKTSPYSFIERLNPATKTEAMVAALGALPDHDDILVQSFTHAGNVVTGFTCDLSTQAMNAAPRLARDIIMRKDREDLARRLFSAAGFTANLPKLETAAAGNGSFCLKAETDGIVRQVPLFVRSPAQPEGAFYPSLSIEGLRVALDPKGSMAIRPVKQKDLEELHGLMRYLAPPYLLKIGPHEIPLSAEGTFYTYFAKADTTRYLPAWQVIDKTVDPARVRDKIILIGTSAEGLKDLRSSPLDLFMPGVEVHRNVIEQILQGKYLYRPDLIAGLERMLTGALGVVVILLSPFIGAAGLMVLAFLTIAGISTLSLQAFLTEGLLIDPIFPSLTIFLLAVGGALLNYLRIDHDRRAIKQAFGLYISPDYMKELTKHPDQLRLGGETRELTVMFTDIRSFTTISESLPPGDLIQMMNDFLTPMTDQVLHNKGTIDKYMGDAIMAFWNAPLPDADHARNACRAALGMNAALAPINAALAEKSQKTGTKPIVLRSGIGVNTGPGAVGNMGSKQRFAYSALGDTVNLASRLESQTKAYGVDILIGEETFRHVQDFATLELDRLQVKGKTKPVTLYTLLGDETTARQPDFQACQQQQETMLSCYRTRDFVGALSLCQKLAGEYPALKGYYEMLGERISKLIKSPPAPEWDGTYVADSK